MAIHPINAEQQNTPVEPSVNTLSNAQLIQKLLNPELRSLIEQYVNQPLLLEKLLIQKNNDALITLKLSPFVAKNKHSSPFPTLQSEIIQLKLPSQIVSTALNGSATTILSSNQPQQLIQPNLPIDIKGLIELFKSANKISLSIDSNQQIVIKIAGLVHKTQSEQITPIIQISFSKVELSPKRELTLSHPLPITQNQSITNTQGSKLVQTSSVQTLELNKNLGEIASSLISPVSNSRNKLATDFIQIESINRQLKENVSKVLNSSSIINNFIKQVEALGVKKNVALDAKIIEFAKTPTINFIQKSNKINIEIQKLIDSITKPVALEKLMQANTAENTKHLVSRLIKSGNLFENALKQRVVKNETSPLNATSKIPSDNKLILSQINSQLEKLIIEIIRYSEKPITTNQIERIEKLLTMQTKDFTPLEKHQLESNKKNTVQKIQNQQEQLQNVIKLSQSLQVIIKSSLQQVEQNQLHSLKSEQFNLQQFLVDLPIKQNGMIDSFEMRFESQGKNSHSFKNKYWKVVVRFDLEPLGPMFAEIQFENERLSTHIFAEKRETGVLINQHLPTLRKSLFSAGVDVNKISGSQGHIPENLSRQDKASIDTHV